MSCELLPISLIEETNCCFYSLLREFYTAKMAIYRIVLKQLLDTEPGVEEFKRVTISIESNGMQTTELIHYDSVCLARIVYNMAVIEPSITFTPVRSFNPGGIASTERETAFCVRNIWGISYLEGGSPEITFEQWLKEKFED